jgi:PhzF family phenazine biosynthesis protein
MKIPLYHVDAFTKKVFGGNPAAVCPLENWLDNKTLQSIAAENYLSETSFFVRSGTAYELRWFTPVSEIDLCGHGTLAAAHVLVNHLGYKDSDISFSSKSGPLDVSIKEALITLNFPSRKPIKIETPSLLVKGLGAEPTEVLKSRDYYAVFENPQDILNLKPNFEILMKFDCLGICVTAKGNNCDFVSRFFAPKIGIQEDPVTGSTHSSLIPYWAEKLNKDSLYAIQLSKRQGELFCKNLTNRVLIGGYAVTYAVGKIEI